MGISPPTGASVNISCEFVRPAGKVGEELYSIGEVVKLGESLYFSYHISLLPSTCPFFPSVFFLYSAREEELTVGRTTAFTKVTFYDKSDKVVAFGSHTKHMGTNKATKRFSEDGETELPFEEKAKL
jgi:acyl-coenzyme A thioesterase 13